MVMPLVTADADAILIADTLAAIATAVVVTLVTAAADTTLIADTLAAIAATMVVALVATVISASPGCTPAKGWQGRPLKIAEQLTDRRYGTTGQILWQRQI